MLTNDIPHSVPFYSVSGLLCGQDIEVQGPAAGSCVIFTLTKT